MSDVTRLLNAVDRGDPKAAEELLPLIYEELRFFCGLTFEEAAQVMSLSEPTLRRYWTYARAWLMQEIKRLKAR